VDIHQGQREKDGGIGADQPQEAAASAPMNCLHLILLLAVALAAQHYVISPMMKPIYRKVRVPRLLGSRWVCVTHRVCPSASSDLPLALVSASGPRILVT